MPFENYYHCLATVSPSLRVVLPFVQLSFTKETNRVNNRVDYYYENKCLISTNIEHWDQYISALRASDTITINRKEYVVNKINLVHDHSKIILKVSIEPLKLYNKHPL